MPTFFTRTTSYTQKVVQVSLIDRIYMNTLQVLKSKIAKINKMGGPNKVRGGGESAKISKN